MGVAAHIVAAAKGGPRADDTMPAEELTAIANGIWLCQTCSKLIDSDTERFVIALLRKWKESAERRARDEIERAARGGFDSDLASLRIYRAYFDRPALQDPMNRCGSYPDFVAALTQLIELVNTGKVGGEDKARSRHELGGVTKPLMETVYHSVRAVRGRYVELRRAGVVDEATCMCEFRDDTQREEFEVLKQTATRDFNAVMREVGLPEIDGPG